MNREDGRPESETLDPDDWEEIRSVGHATIDDMVDYLRDVGERPAWQSPSADARQAMNSPLPRRGRPLHEVYEQFKSTVLPYPTGNIHPRFWGWVMGNGTPVGMLAELLGGKGKVKNKLGLTLTPVSANAEAPRPGPVNAAEGAALVSEAAEGA